MVALIALARGLLARGISIAAGTPGRAALTAAAGGTALGAFGGIPGVDLFPGGVKRRRRRRNMFTSTDMAQFAAVASIAGRKAAESVMMIRAAKA